MAAKIIKRPLFRHIPLTGGSQHRTRQKIACTFIRLHRQELAGDPERLSDKFLRRLLEVECPKNRGRQ